MENFDIFPSLQSFGISCIDTRFHHDTFLYRHNIASFWMRSFISVIVVIVESSNKFHAPVGDFPRATQ